MLIDARKHLEEQVSQLKREIASVRAKLEKARTIQNALAGLETQLDLRMAAIKRQVLRRMIPRRVHVMSVQGIGSGVGLSLGKQLFSALQGEPGRVHQDERVWSTGDPEAGCED
jgi:hypothetical protein